MALYRGEGGAGDANNTVSINEIQQLSSDAQLAKNYAEEWANKAEDSLVSSDAGGDQVDDYSAMHHAQKASDNATLTAADVVSTNADVVTTNNNVSAAQTAQTGAETAETNALVAKDAAEAAAATVPSYPTLTGNVNNFVRLASGETAMEFRTPANVLSDIGAEPADATIVKDADIGSTVQGYDAGLAFLDGLNFTNETTFKQGVNLEIGTDIQSHSALLDDVVTENSIGRKNLLINADFRIDQRDYVSGTATTVADEYTLDRWRVVTLGQSITFAALGTDNTITCPAAGLGQKVEPLNIAGGSYTISWTGTATCTVDAVARTNGETFTLTANTQADVIFSSGTVKEAQLEKGSVATDFEHRPIGEELALCQRYFERFGDDSACVIGVAACSSSTRARAVVKFKPKRTTPTITSNNTGMYIFTGASNITSTAVDYSVISKNTAIAQIDVASGLTAGEAEIARTIDASNPVDIDAEL